MNLLKVDCSLWAFVLVSLLCPRSGQSQDLSLPCDPQNPPVPYLGTDGGVCNCQADEGLDCETAASQILDGQATDDARRGILAGVESCELAFEFTRTDALSIPDFGGMSTSMWVPQNAVIDSSLVWRHRGRVES